MPDKNTDITNLRDVPPPTLGLVFKFKIMSINTAIDVFFLLFFLLEQLV
jgi:hypothetical protein